MTHEDKAWLAGLVEGEGSFSFQSNPSRLGRRIHPRFGISMTDEDVMMRAAGLMNAKACGPYRRPNRKPFWSIKLFGDVALRFGLDMFPYMGERRQEQIANQLELDMQRREGIRYV